MILLCIIFRCTRCGQNQAKVHDEKKQSTDAELKNPADAVKGMGDMLTADDQLEHWKGTQPKS